MQKSQVPSWACLNQNVSARFPRDSYAHLNVTGSELRHKGMPLKESVSAALLQIFKVDLGSGNGSGLLCPVGLFNSVQRFWGGWAYFLEKSLTGDANVVSNSSLTSCPACSRQPLL